MLKGVLLSVLLGLQVLAQVLQHQRSSGQTVPLLRWWDRNGGGPAGAGLIRVSLLLLSSSQGGFICLFSCCLRTYEGVKTLLH